MKNRPPEKQQKRAERAEKLEVIRLVLRADADLEWEGCRRKVYPDLYFSELVKDEYVASSTKNKVNNNYYPVSLYNKMYPNPPCHYEPSKSVKGSFRVIVSLDAIHCNENSDLMKRYRSIQNSICERLNTVCAEMTYVNFKASIPKNHNLPVIFAEICSSEYDHDCHQVLKDVFVNLAGTIGLYPNDTRYSSKESYFLSQFFKSVIKGSIALTGMKGTLCPALLDLFELSDKIQNITPTQRSNIAGMVFLRSTSPLPRDVGSLLANVGLISGQTALNLKEALLAAVEKDSSTTSASQSKFRWR